MATHATSVTETVTQPGAQTVSTISMRFPDTFFFVAGQPTVMARLQGLFPAHQPPLDITHPRSRTISKPLRNPPKFMKVRIVTCVLIICCYCI